jgi:hypothetical protein
MARCPPGVFCITPGLVFLVTTLVFLAVLFALTTSKKTSQEPVRATTVVASPPIQIVNEGGDDRYTRAPRPQRFWNNGPELPPRGGLLPPDGGRLINLRTQGIPEAYQSMGLLRTDEGKLLPLYGRRVASRSDRFNYYTRTDSYNPIPLPIHFQRKDCQDDVGCQEVFDGDRVQVNPTGETAVATLYRFDGPTYIPGIV